MRRREDGRLIRGENTYRPSVNLYSSEAPLCAVYLLTPRKHSDFDGIGTEKVAVVVVSSQKGRRCKRKSGRANSEYDDSERGTPLRMQCRSPCVAVPVREQ